MKITPGKTTQRTIAAVTLISGLTIGGTIAPAQAETPSLQSSKAPLLSNPDSARAVLSQTSNHGSYENVIFVAGNILAIGGAITALIGLYNAGVQAGYLPPVPVPTPIPVR